MIPAGWIPRDCRQPVYARLTDEEVAEVRESMTLVDEHGNHIYENDEEIRQKVRRIRGVIDTRDGSYYPNKYFKD